MNDAHMRSIDDIRDFLQANHKLTVTISTRKDRYEWIMQTLLRFRYRRLTKTERGILKRYIQALTGYSPIQAKRLIKKYYKGKLRYTLITRKRNKFKRTYGPEDIALLAKTDVLHCRLSGRATQKILRREFKDFGNHQYETIACISASHIYNIRNNNRQYRSSGALTYTKTQPTAVSIGIRRKPDPRGTPGFLRVDTVHQGDLDKEKGVYHINVVDEVTQYEMIATVERIAERYLRPVLIELLFLFPFRIYEFHSDNGSEYVNHIVAKLLNKLHIELTKSRSRHSNDNALVESKNGSVIRKHYGRNYIAQKHARLMQTFNKTFMNPYLNYHRPCGFAEDRIDRRGKVRKKYTHWMMPYEKLKSLDHAEQYLKNGTTFDQLDRIAYAESDNEFAERMTAARAELFKKLSKK